MHCVTRDIQRHDINVCYKYHSMTLATIVEYLAILIPLQWVLCIKQIKLESIRINVQDIYVWFIMLKYLIWFLYFQHYATTFGTMYAFICTLTLKITPTLLKCVLKSSLRIWCCEKCLPFFKLANVPTVCKVDYCMCKAIVLIKIK